MRPEMKEVLGLYPLATKEAIIWFTKIMFKSLEDENVPDEMKDYVEQRGVTEEQLASLLEINSRVLLDFFDDNEVYVEIFVSIKDKAMFRYAINNEEYGTFIYHTRKQAEAVAIMMSFEILNTKLETSNETDNKG